MRPLSAFFGKKRIIWNNAVSRAEKECGKQIALDGPMSKREENRTIKNKAKEIYNWELMQRKARKKLPYWENR